MIRAAGQQVVRKGVILRNDHKVDFRTEEAIKALAENARALLDPSGQPAFRVTDCIRKLKKQELFKQGKFEIKTFRRSAADPPAYVTFEPMRTLYIDEDIWEDADQNLPLPKYIVAHELGHLVLHSHYAQPYSGIKDKWIQKDELSAEWQADRFADYFLVSDAEVQFCITPNAIANHCGVERDVAIRRLGKKFKYFGDCCAACGNFALVRRGADSKCDICGNMSKVM